MAAQDELRTRFLPRQTLSMSELAREFSVSRADAESLLKECLGLFEQEYGIPAGLLRSDDSLNLFVEPPATWNPISWVFRRAAWEDSTSELNYRLKKRRRAMGRSLDRSPKTVGDYVSAWVGQPDTPT